MPLRTDRTAAELQHEAQGRRAKQHQAELAKRATEPPDAYVELLAFVHADPKWKELTAGAVVLALLRTELEKFVAYQSLLREVDKRERELVGEWFAARVAR